MKRVWSASAPSTGGLVASAFCVVTALCWATPAQAYVGPGAGLSALGALVFLVLFGLIMVVGFVWYPLKRLLRRKSVRPREPTEDDTERV